jgi:Uma2 family endonuclease
VVATRLVTIDEVEHLPDGQRYDLIRGRLSTSLLAGRRHGRISSRLGFLLTAYAANHGGEAYGAETGFILARNPDTLLGPDVAYIRPERITHDLPEDGYLPIAPDLAVEVLSPSNTRAEMAEKIDAYLTGGTVFVWVVDPVRKTASVHMHDCAVQVLGVGETLDGGDVLPGLRVAVADIFR